MWENEFKETEYIYSEELHKNIYPDFLKNAARSSCYKEWTVIIYMAADNDLSPFAKEDIYEMQSVGSTLSVDIVVEADFIDRGGSRRFHLQKSPDKFKNLSQKSFSEIAPEHLYSPIIDKLPELDSGDVKNFYNFLEFSATNFPAKHYMIIIWSHGQGWASEQPVRHISELSNTSTFNNVFETEASSKNLMGGLAFDYTSGSHFSIPQITNALDSFNILFNDSEPIDIYGSDACYMQMVEVAYEFKNVAKFVIGSSQQEEYRGWPYRDILSFLTENPVIKKKAGEIIPEGGKDAAFMVATRIPKFYRDSYYSKKSSQGFYPEATMSTIRAENFTATAYFPFRYNLNEMSNSEKNFLTPLPTAKSDINNETIVPGINLVSLSFPEALNNFAEALYLYMEEDPTGKLRLEYALKKSISHSPLAIDLYYLTEMLLFSFYDNPVYELTHRIYLLKKTARALQDVIKNVSVSYAFCSEYEDESNSVKVLSIWFPGSKEDLKNYREIFSSSTFYKDLSKKENFWLKVFEKLYSDSDPFAGFTTL